MLTVASLISAAARKVLTERLLPSAAFRRHQESGPRGLQPTGQRRKLAPQMFSVKPVNHLEEPGSIWIRKCGGGAYSLVTSSPVKRLEEQRPVK